MAHRREPGLGERVRHVHRPEPDPPARRQRGADELRLILRDRGDVEHRRAIQIQGDGALPGEHLPHPPLAEQRLQRHLQRLDELAVALDRAAVKRRRPHALRGALDRRQQIGQDRCASVALVEDPQGGGEHRVLAIVRRVAALDADQRGDHRVPAADRVGEHLAPELRVLTVAQLLGGGLGEGDVEHV